MTQPDPNRYSRRGFARWATGSLLLGGNCFVPAGCRPRVIESSLGRELRVSGPSMNPSFWDASRHAACPRCAVSTRVDEGLLNRVLQLREMTSSHTDVRCWHCGENISAEQIRAWLSLPATPPNTVRVIECAADPLQAGDVVLISKSGKVHLKRILATPGQSVTSDEAGRLLVDQQRPWFPSMPAIMVDRDSHRTVSRWHSYDSFERLHDASRSASAATAPWYRDDERQWTTSAPSDWLVYEHHSVYRGDQPAQILDDYPGNIGIAGKLFPADGLSLQLRLRLEPSDSQRQLKTYLALWREEKVEQQMNVLSVPPQCTEIVIDSRAQIPGLESSKFPLPCKLPRLSASRPIGLALSLESRTGVLADSVLCRISNLAVDREVLYRNHMHVRESTNASHKRVSTPLASDEWFVVGDNVPLSVDSRNWGNVHTHEMIGRVDQPHRQTLPIRDRVGESG